LLALLIRDLRKQAPILRSASVRALAASFASLVPSRATMKGISRAKTRSSPPSAFATKRLIMASFFETSFVLPFS
jgi:hypothetical protein